MRCTPDVFEPCIQCEDEQRNVGSGYPNASQEYSPEEFCPSCLERWERSQEFGFDKNGRMESREIEFTVKCKMKVRWVPYFIGMLKLMQNLGSLGGSRVVSFYSDGDGDYRPKFEFEGGMPKPAPGVWKMDKEGDECCFFDAG